MGEERDEDLIELREVVRLLETLDEAPNKGERLREIERLLGEIADNINARANVAEFNPPN